MRRVLVVAVALALIPAFPPAHGSPVCYSVVHPVSFDGSMTPEMLGDDRVVDFTPVSFLPGYYLVTARGSVFAFGDAVWMGSAALPEGETVITQVIISGYRCQGEKLVGYLLVTDRGRVIPFGDAAECGSIAPDDLGDQRVVEFVMGSPYQCEYSMLTDRGNVYSFGTSPWCGSLPEGALGDQRAVTLVDFFGRRCGYVVFTDHGNAYAFGRVRWHGSMTAEMLGQQRVIDVEHSWGDGYTMFTDRGNAYSFGEARWPGPVGVQGERIVGVEDRDLVFGEFGGVFALGRPKFKGSASGLLAQGERVVEGTLGFRGYYIATDRGHVYAFGE